MMWVNIRAITKKEELFRVRLKASTYCHIVPYQLERAKIALFMKIALL